VTPEERQEIIRLLAAADEKTHGRSRPRVFVEIV